MTAVATKGCGCGTAAPAAGCGCGSGGLTRPNFFAGQLLAEDDLNALATYITAKGRLHNRMLYGSGVVCGLDVVCDPCGCGGVTVLPGYALDCCGHDLVLDARATVDIAGLLRDLRGCDSPIGTAYGLYLRYVEQRVEPIAAYPTDDTCGGDCTPSRVRETYDFLLKPDDSHRHDDEPGSRLARCLGPAGEFAAIRARALRLERYRAVSREIILAGDLEPEFAGADSAAFFEALQLLSGMGAEVPDEATGRLMTERLRRLAALVARSLAAGNPDSDVAGRLEDARGAVAVAAKTLAARDQQASKDWPDPVARSTAATVVAESVRRLGPTEGESGRLERLMMVAGTPLSPSLRRELAADLRRLRDWLTVRLETVPDRADCALPSDLAAIRVPDPIPGDILAEPADLRGFAHAARRMLDCLRRFIADCACRGLLPAGPDCADADVLLARLTVRDTSVVRICTIDRPQAQARVPDAWLIEARGLATRICCPPAVEEGEPGSPVAPVLAYVEGLLDPPLYDTDLDRLLALLLDGPHR